VQTVEILGASLSWRPKGLSRMVMGQLYFILVLTVLTVGQSHIYISYYHYPTKVLNTADKYKFTFINPTHRIATKPSA